MSLQNVPTTWQEIMSILAIGINLIGFLAIVFAFGYAAWVQEGLGAAIEERLSFVDDAAPEECANDPPVAESDTSRDEKCLDLPVAIELSEFSTSGVPVMGSVNHEGASSDGEGSSVVVSPPPDEQKAVDETAKAVAEEQKAATEPTSVESTAVAQDLTQLSDQALAYVEECGLSLGELLVYAQNDPELLKLLQSQDSVPSNGDGDASPVLQI